MNWSGNVVAITGGEGFIGQRLAMELHRRGASVYTYDKRGSEPIDTNLGRKEFTEAMKSRDTTHAFLLAANFGGRGYIEDFPADCAETFAMDSNSWRAALDAGVSNVFYSSSACVYPDSLQQRPDAHPLAESDVLSTGDGIKSIDSLYGYAKLMGELQATAYHDQYGLETSTARFLTVYGPGENDTHALTALSNRVKRREDPFLIWGRGTQARGFTHVDDIVRGIILCSERISDGTPVNLGTPVHYTVDEVVGFMFDVAGWRPTKIEHDLSKPEGPFCRALDISRAKSVLGWEPQVPLMDGLRQLILEAPP